MSLLPVPVLRLAHAADLPLPAYATPGSAGIDLPAAVEGPVILAPGERMAVPTGLCLALPHGYEAQLRPRSGLALHHGIGLLNAPGTIDSDYRGEIMAILVHHGTVPFTIERGMRIAQMVIAPVTRIALRETSALDSTPRGAGGFGSTGGHSSIVKKEKES